jgi:TatA/E family protein of Tat protein translocase
MFNLGLPEFLIIAVVVFFLFGGKRLSGLGKGLGEAIKGLRDGFKEMNKDE